MVTGAMDDIADRYAGRGVTSVFIYTREAHPGENFPEHRNMEGKVNHARALRTDFGMRRRILVDELDGSCHRAFGILPNMTWILGRGGLVLYKSTWTAPADVEDALVQSLDHLERRRNGEPLAGFYAERLAWRAKDEETFQAGLERAGPRAVRDFYGRRKD